MTIELIKSEALLSSAETMIASYPRSGLNWIRYCIEYFSQQPTPGRTLLYGQGSKIIARSHDLSGISWWGKTQCLPLYNDDGISPYRRLILLLRNYKEGLASEGCDDFERMEPYFANLLAYDSYCGEKMCVYYEDLVVDFCWVRQILRFIKINPNVADFDLPYHFNKSQLIYHARRYAYTRCEREDFTYHSRRLALVRRQEADAYFESRLGMEIYDRYLARYHETALAYPT